jgi:transposase
MEIEILLRHLLPDELFEYFDLVSINEINTKELNLHLDEKKVPPPEHHDKKLISYGFDDAVKVQDFPLRKKSVYLLVRRRKWQEKETGKIYIRSWDLTAGGSSYSKEFADFLKGLFRHIPDKLK